MAGVVDIVRALTAGQTVLLFVVAVLLVGLVAGYLTRQVTRRILRRFGVPALVEGTVFDRTARGLGTSTVGIVSGLAMLFVYAGALVVALGFLDLLDATLLWSLFYAFLPKVFVAALALIVSLVVGDKAKVLVSERLRSVKVPEVGIIPELVKYSIFYIGSLIALGQLGVVTEALLIMLAGYLFGLAFLGGLAFKDLLAAGAAGIYLLLTAPYSIGDRVRIDDDQEGIVQEVEMFVTRIESDGEELVVPNQLVLRSSIVRIRE